MKILIYTANSHEWQRLAEITLPPKCEYAARHGYELWSDRVFPNLAPFGILGFQKVKDLIAILENNTHDWVWWNGADVLLTNPEITLESIIALAPPATELIIANDCLMWQADSFLVKRCPRVIDYLKKVLMRDTPLRYGLAEQETMWALKNMVNHHEVPQRILNSYFYEFRANDGCTPQHRANVVAKRDLLGNDGQWQPGDFVIHLTPLEYQARVAVAAQMANGKIPHFKGNHIIFDT